MPLPWWASTSTIADPLVAGVAQRLRRDRGVVEVAGAADARRASRGGPAAGTARRRAARRRRTRSAAVQRAVGGRAGRLPGARADQRHRVVDEPAGVGVHRDRGPGGQPGGHRRRREEVGHHPVLADELLVRARPPSASAAVRRNSSRSASCTDARQRRSGRRGGPASTSRWPSPRSASRIASTRAATSVPGGGDADPHLAVRVVPPGVGRPHHGDRLRLSHESVSHRGPSPGEVPRRQDGGMPRARDLGIGIGTLPAGPTNSVLDVAGVGLGHVTAASATRTRRRPAAASPAPASPSLLLAEDAYRRPLAAGGAVLNGAGECTGFLTAGEWGAVETPVYLTSTMQLGRVYDAACEIALDAATPGWPTTWSSRWSASATTRSSTTAAGCRSPPTTSGRRTTRRWPRAGRRPRPTRARSAPGPACRASASRAASAPSSRVTPRRPHRRRCCC